MPDKSCTSQQAGFLSKRTFSVENEVDSSVLQLCSRGGKIPGGTDSQLELFLFSICGLCPAHQVLTASFSSSQRLACLLLKGWVSGQTCTILGKDSSFEGQRPNSCWCCHYVIFTALCTTWCFKGQFQFQCHVALSHQSPTLPRNCATLQ